MNTQVTFRGMVNMGAIHKGWDMAVFSNSQITSLDLFSWGYSKELIFKMRLGKEKHVTPLEFSCFLH